MSEKRSLAVCMAYEAYNFVDEIIELLDKEETIAIAKAYPKNETRNLSFILDDDDIIKYGLMSKKGSPNIENINKYICEEYKEFKNLRILSVKSNIKTEVV